MKRTLSMLLALVMVLSLCVPALAAQAPTLTAQPSELTAGGSDKDIVLTSTKDFAEEVQTGQVTLEGSTEEITVSNVQRTDNTKITVTLSAAPKKSDTLTLKVNKAAFSEQPNNDPTVSVTVNKATPQLADNSTGEIVEGASEVTVKLKISDTSGGIKFKTGSWSTKDFTVTEGGLTVGDPTGSDGETVEVKLTGTVKAGELKIKANASAFTEDVSCGERDHHRQGEDRKARLRRRWRQGHCPEHRYYREIYRHERLFGIA